MERKREKCLRITLNCPLVALMQLRPQESLPNLQYQQLGQTQHNTGHNTTENQKGNNRCIHCVHPQQQALHRLTGRRAQDYH